MNYGIDCVHGFGVGEICPYCPSNAEGPEREVVESAQKIRHMRTLNGWLGTIVEAALPDFNIDEGREPTYEQIQRALRGVRELIEVLDSLVRHRMAPEAYHVARARKALARLKEEEGEA